MSNSIKRKPSDEVGEIMQKRVIIKEISKSVEVQIGDPKIKQPAFATCKQLAGAFAYRDAPSFRKNYLATIEPVPGTNLYCIADLADAIFRGEVPVKKTRKGRTAEEMAAVRSEKG